MSVFRRKEPGLEILSQYDSPLCINHASEIADLKILATEYLMLLSFGHCLYLINHYFVSFLDCKNIVS